MQAHAITTARTARYYTAGAETPAGAREANPPGEREAHGPVREVWLACHGYGQLAGRFLAGLDAVRAPGRLLVAPEGLSRFYVDDRHERVGASWMTREAREDEIDDQ